MKPPENKTVGPAQNGAPKTLPAGPSPGRRVGGFRPRAVGAYIPKITAKVFAKNGFSTLALITDWPSIVGRDAATYTVPQRLNWPRHAKTPDADDGMDPPHGRAGATLILAVDPARALDVEYRAAQLIEAVNAYLGYRAVTVLKVVQSPTVFTGQRCKAAPRLPAFRAEPAVSSAAETEPLRAALARLGSHVLARASR